VALVGADPPPRLDGERPRAAPHAAAARYRTRRTAPASVLRELVHSCLSCVRALGQGDSALRSGRAAVGCCFALPGAGPGRLTQGARDGRRPAPARAARQPRHADPRTRHAPRARRVARDPGRYRGGPVPCVTKTGNFHGNLHTPRHPPYATPGAARLPPRRPPGVGGRAEAPSGRAESQSRGGRTCGVLSFSLTGDLVCVRNTVYNADRETGDRVP
jgi:hypothetical protein